MTTSQFILAYMLFCAWHTLPIMIGIADMAPGNRNTHAQNPDQSLPNSAA